ncbi:MAG: M1 family metallopeptidase [Gammaproteobacteria bacterium]
MTQKTSFPGPISAWLRWMMLALTIIPSVAFPITRHQLEVWLKPAEGTIRVLDRIQTEQPYTAIEFSLRSTLEVSSPQGGTIEATAQHGNRTIYRLTQREAGEHFLLEIQGRIQSDTRSSASGYDRGITSNNGVISDKGVYLGPESGWYADTGDRMGFAMKVQLPSGWKAVSQGKGEHSDGISSWHEPSPQEGIYLVANRFHYYVDDRAEAYLRAPDETLAKRYLSATHRHLKRFEALIGPYPYAKFALVENTWESGFGMPSFTLLGSRVIRLPFILHSSYPHEILHNWWGNGVYPEYAGGNWSEGLTTYLADHALQAERGQGSAYRRRLLKQFMDHAGNERDFPLSEFTARHSGRAQAVGYGKATMVFHMLRVSLGEQRFLEGLRRLFDEYRFRTASWGDIRTVMESVSNRDLGPFFQQWIQGTGMARLSLESLQRGNGQLSLTISQTQPGPALPMSVPIVITDADGQTRTELLSLGQGTSPKRATLRIPDEDNIQRLSIDPDYHTFRALYPDESPPAISSLLGAEQVTLVLPEGAEPAIREAYQALADAWSSDGRITVISDHQALPAQGAVWILGHDNQRLAELMPEWTAADIKLPGRAFRFGDASAVLIGQTSTGRTVGLIDLFSPPTAALLARKLPHYGRYGYLIFEGDEASNSLKGEWPATSRSLSVEFSVCGASLTC